RVFQITPSNEAMGVLLEAGLHSASAIAAVGYDRFVSRYGDHFPQPGDGDIIYRRSELVSSVTYALFTGAHGIGSSTPVQAISGGASTVQSSQQNIIEHYPTLEQLFGSLDFCECKECRSVLSPAAYLVDLLQYLNPPTSAWNTFTTHWNSTHDKKFADDF